MLKLKSAWHMDVKNALPQWSMRAEMKSRLNEGKC